MNGEEKEKEKEKKVLKKKEKKKHTWHSANTGRVDIKQNRSKHTKRWGKNTP